MIIVKDLSIERADKQIFENINLSLVPGNITILKGKNGSGKTTLIKQILIDLNVIDNISSPTFSIINEYKTKSTDLIYHMDLYRINKIEELEEIGFFEYLESGNLCFIEWGEIIENIIGEDYNKFNIIENGDLRILEKIK